MTIESEHDVAYLSVIGRVVSLTRQEMIQAVRPGISTSDLDILGEKILSSFGARSAPRYEYDFPGATCISVNDEAAHGIPGKRVLQSGDIVNIDVSAELNGYFADTGATVVVDGAGSFQSRLCNCSQKALEQGIAQAKSRSRLNRIGRAIQNEVEKNGFTVIKNLTGHGIGRRLHEKPDYIPDYYDKWDKRLLKAGMVLAIESFVSSGADHIIEDKNGWTYKTPDRSLVAQFEHTVIVTEQSPIILTK